MCRAASYGAAAVTAEARQALDGLDEVAPLDEVAKRLDGEVSPALLALAKALVVQAGGLGAVTPDRGGVRRVREAVRADREGLGPSRQLLGGAAVRADRPGPAASQASSCLDQSAYSSEPTTATSPVRSSSARAVKT